MPTLLALTEIGYVYPGTPPTRALDRVTLSVAPGEFLAIEGRSGNGKSSLLSVLALLSTPTSGRYTVQGQDVTRLTRRDQARARSRLFGFVFQSFHLLDHRTVRDNVELGLVYRGVPASVRHERARQALREVGLEDKADQRAGQLSGGECQRVAIARALAVGAPVVVADEPTGNLDTGNSRAVVEVLERLHARGHTVVLVTHDPAVAGHAQRRIRISDGAIISDTGARAQAPTTDPIPPGRDSVQRPRDLVRDAAASIASRWGKTAALVAAVAVGVGLAVATLGISQSARSQVSDRFDATLNREVTATAEAPTDQVPVLPVATRLTDASSVAARLDALAGLDAYAVLTDNDQHQLRTTPTSPALNSYVYGSSGDLAGAARARIVWAGSHRAVLGPGEVLVGRGLARTMHLGPLSGAPTIAIDNHVFAVVGLIEHSARVPDLDNNVVTDLDSAQALHPALRTRYLLRTRPGAAQQIAGQLPVAVDPVAPQRLTVEAPADPSTLRDQIESDVRTTLYVLTGVAILAAIVSLTNAMMLSVVERTREFGLRRALGARPVHVVAQVMLESTLVGALGGGVGTLLGMTAILGVTITQHWVPVLDTTLVPLALAGGILVGALGGLIAAARAGRIDPGQALRQ